MEKRITSPLMEPSSIEKIVEIDSHIGTEKGFSLGGPSGSALGAPLRFGIIYN